MVSYLQEDRFYKNTRVEMLQSMVKYLKQFETYEPKTEGRVRKRRFR